MYDVQLLSMTSDELILAGIERLEGLNPIHCAQCWLATPIELVITPVVAWRTRRRRSRAALGLRRGADRACRTNWQAIQCTDISGMEHW